MRGALWRWQRWEDLAGVVTLRVIAAWGGGQKEDGAHLTLEDLLGREPVSLLPPPTLTEAERESQEWEEMQAAAKRDRANLMLYRMQLELAKRQHGGGPEIVSG